MGQCYCMGDRIGSPIQYAPLRCYLLAQIRTVFEWRELIRLASRHENSCRTSDQRGADGLMSVHFEFGGVDDVALCIGYTNLYSVDLDFIKVRMDKFGGLVIVCI